MQKLIKTIKELKELVAQFNKLLIELISTVGWILVLIHIANQ